MTNSPAEGNVPQFDMADRLRKALREADLSVQDMADYIGVSRNSVGAWINGRTVPNKASLMLWAMRTGVPFKWLKTGENPHQVDPDEGLRITDEAPSRSVLPRVDSNHQPAGYPARPAYSAPVAA